MSTTTDATAPAAAPTEGLVNIPGATPLAPTTDGMVATPTVPAAPVSDGLAAHTPAPAATTAPADHPAPNAAAPNAHGHGEGHHTKSSTTQSHHPHPHHATSTDPNLPMVYQVKVEGSDQPNFLIVKGEARLLIDEHMKPINEVTYTCPLHNKNYVVTSTEKEKATVTASEHAHGAHTHMKVSGNIQFNGHTTTATGEHGATVQVADVVKEAVAAAAPSPVEYTVTPPAPAAPTPVSPTTHGFTGYVANRPPMTEGVRAQA